MEFQKKTKVGIHKDAKGIILETTSKQGLGATARGHRIPAGQENRDVSRLAGPKRGQAGQGSLIIELLFRVRSAIPGSLGEIGRQSGILATSTGRNHKYRGEPNLGHKIRPFDLSH